MDEIVSKAALYGLVVMVFAIRPKFHKLKPGRERWVFKGDKSQ
jgi:hypothetical protein